VDLPVAFPTKGNSNALRHRARAYFAGSSRSNTDRCNKESDLWWRWNCGGVGFYVFAMCRGLEEFPVIRTVMLSPLRWGCENPFISSPKC